jgi:hypothetical protein
MTRKQIESIKSTLPRFEEKTEEQKKTYKELFCREMINSILIYGGKPRKENGEYGKYLQDYVNELGKDKVDELIDEQEEEFSKAIVGYAGTDNEGLSYNYCRWADEQ